MLSIVRRQAIWSTELIKPAIPALFVAPQKSHACGMNHPMITSLEIAGLVGDTHRVTELLTLNNDHAAELSWLDREALIQLVRVSFATRVVGEADALLIALDQMAPYDNPNFAWFRARYPKFVYVDRVVVAEAARGRGVARILYKDLFLAARAAGHEVVVCEVNMDPPNPASDAFHATLGFNEVGSAVIHAGKKRVRYFQRTL